MDQLNLTDECLCGAARRNDLETLKTLIATKEIKSCTADLSVNITETPHPLDFYPGSKDFENRDSVNTLSCLNRALHYICDDYNSNGDTEGVKLLLDAGAEVDVKDTSNQTPLLKAAGEKFMDIMKLLITRGADIYVPDMLYEPVVRGYEEVVEFLLEQGVVPPASYVATAFNNANIIRMILKKNPDIITDRDELFPAMGQMAKLHMNDLLELLVEHGVDPNIVHPTRPQRYVLHVAAAYRNKWGIKLLLKAGAKVNLHDKDLLASQQATETVQHVRKQLDAFGIPSENLVEWRSPLFVATKRFEDLDMLCQILEAGANVLAVTKKGRLPLHVASPHTMPVHLLACEPYNCPLDVKDLVGMTPLMINVSEEEWTWYCPPLSHENPCIMLLQHGASYEHDPAGRTFLYHMARHQKLSPNICQVVIYSGNPLQVILQDIQQVQEMAEKQEDTSGHQWLVDFLTNSESLKMMCVRAIRSHLRKARLGLSIWGSIFRLPLPATMVQLLTLNRLQPDFGPWKLYSSVDPHVLKEFSSLYPEED